MKWCGKNILDISREFLDTNGIKQEINIEVTEPNERSNYFKQVSSKLQNNSLSEAWIENLKDINIASQKGLVERFDSTIGAGTVIMPFGGKYKLTPAEGMIAKIPVLYGETNTCTIMTYGYDSKLAKWSPFHGAVYSVVSSIAKVVAMGGDYRKTRLTLQEYFERLGDNPKKWGKPFSALLGAFYVQKQLDIPAIGGKDSMSGTFKDINVPPTLVSFAVNVANVKKVISPEFKGTKNHVVLIEVKRETNEMIDFEELGRNFTRIYELIQEGKVLASHTVEKGGIAATVSKMSFGNKIGMKFDKEIERKKLFAANYGSIILEIDEKEDIEDLLKDIEYEILGYTQKKESIEINGVEIELNNAIKQWEEPLDSVFDIKEDILETPKEILYDKGNKIKSSIKVVKPRVFVPVFPGTNCEYDLSKSFERAGGKVENLVFKNLTSKDIEESIYEMVKKINSSQIIALPGGFSAGDEPDGSGKFIATVFRNPRVKEAVMNLLKNRDGLMIGICNGFQALIKLGLVPFGEMVDIKEDYPTLTFNKIGRHVSNMVQTKVVSNLSPWFNNVNVGDIHTIPISHGEGRFVANEQHIKKMIENGQIATQYVDFDGKPSYDGTFKRSEVI